jgi:hypothetical protein
VTAVEFAAKLNARRCEDCWSAKCPAHDDCRASLSIGLGDDNRVLVKRHAGRFPDLSSSRCAEKYSSKRRAGVTVISSLAVTLFRELHKPGRHLVYA